MNVLGCLHVCVYKEHLLRPEVLFTDSNLGFKKDPILSKQSLL